MRSPSLDTTLKVTSRQGGLAPHAIATSLLCLVDCGMDDLPSMREWRKRYEDREVDFADQTLVWLADRCRTNLIATTDFDDFEAYRLPNGKAFKLLIARP